mgnify:CR=1 FL=1
MNQRQGPLARVSWGLRDMLLAGCAAVACVILGIVLLLGGMALWRGVGLAALPKNVLMLAVFSLEAVLLIPAWIWGGRKYGGGWRSLGLRRFALLKAAVLGLFAFSGILAINAMWDVVRKRLGLAPQPDYLPLFGEGLGGLASALILGGVVAPLAEEVFFRGYLYAGFRERFGIGWGAVISALLFSVVHLTPGVLVPIFFMGILLALLYEYTDSLWPSIVLHGAINSLAFIGAYLVERFPQLMPGT